MGLLDNLFKSKKNTQTIKQPEISDDAKKIIDNLHINNPDLYRILIEIIDLKNNPDGPDKITVMTGIYMTKVFNIMITDYEDLVVKGGGKKEFWNKAEKLAIEIEKLGFKYGLKNGAPSFLQQRDMIKRVKEEQEQLRQEQLRKETSGIIK